MLGAGLQFRSRNGEDRFYSVTRARPSQEQLGRAQSQDISTRSRSVSGDIAPEKLKAEIPASPPVSEPSPLCNLERFLESVTPWVQAQYLSKMKARSWRTCHAEFQPFFVLSDLWESFKEWSAYGVGVSLILNGHEGVVQYYVPYLSGIQLYADRSKSIAKLRQIGEERDGECSWDSSSDGSSDSDHERVGLNYTREQLLSLQEGFSSDEGEYGSSQGKLLFEYLERDPPFCREPLANKIFDLALHFPELKTLRSCDLHPSSWISVAWYPIYRIPTGPTLRDLDACFLTYHSLHTPITGSEAMHPPIVKCTTSSDGVPQISLPVFGLASYKFKASTWTPNNTGYHRLLANTLSQAASDWLSLLRVNHPDFSFFHRR